MGDDDVLVDASAEDIGCAGTAWECKFCLVGEKVMNFDVYETNLDGVPLETRGTVLKRETYSHQCTVFLNEVSPKIAEASEKTTVKASRGLSEFFASCCLVNHAEDSVEVEGCVVPVAANHIEESMKSSIGVEPAGVH